MSSNQPDELAKTVQSLIDKGDLEAARSLLKEARAAASRSKAECAEIEQEFAAQEERLTKIIGL